MNKHLPLSKDIRNIIGKYTLPPKIKNKLNLYLVDAVKHCLDTNTIRYEVCGHLYKCPDFKMSKYKYEKFYQFWTLRPKFTGLKLTFSEN